MSLGRSSRALTWTLAAYGLMGLASATLLFGFVPGKNGTRYYHRVVTQRLQHLQAIASQLPASNTYGYLTDAGYPVAKRAELQAEQAQALETEWRYNVAQYVLAPAFLKNTTRARWVLGSFQDPDQAESVYRQHHLRLVRDFGHGLMLLEPAPSP